MRWRPVVRRLCVGKQITADSGTLRLISDFENSSCYKTRIHPRSIAGKLAACHFMACLCERMYPNYAMFCKQTEFGDGLLYRRILDLIWETLTVKDAKVFSTASWRSWKRRSRRQMISTCTVSIRP